MRAINDDVDDDGEYMTFSFGTLPELVYAGDQASTRVDLVDDDDPPVEVFFEQANYEVTNIQQDGNTEYARLNVKVKLSAAPERFIDVGIVAESIQGGGDIHFEYSAYIPRGPHSGAHFHADDTEFTLQIYISARGGFDPNQTYRLTFDGMSYRMSAGSPATADDHDKCKSLSRISIAMPLRKAGVPAAVWLHHPPNLLRQAAALCAPGRGPRLCTRTALRAGAAGPRRRGGL